MSKLSRMIDDYVQRGDDPLSFCEASLEERIHADAMHAPIARPLGHYYTDADDDRAVLIVACVLFIAFALTFGAGVLCGRVWV